MEKGHLKRQMRSLEYLNAVRALPEPSATSVCTFIGASGWNYKHWSGGIFYLKGIKPVLKRSASWCRPGLETAPHFSFILISGKDPVLWPSTS
jgi:hypothetical protein